MLWAFEISLNQIYLRDLLFEVMDKQADIDLMDNVQKKMFFKIVSTDEYLTFPWISKLLSSLRE